MDFLSIIEKVFGLIRPPENATPRQLYRWGWNVALMIFSFVIFAAWALSPYGFITISDADDKIQTVEKELSNVKDQITDINNKLAGISASQRETQRINMQTKIIEYKERFCKAPSAEAAQTWKNLYVDYQNQCVSIFGDTSQACIPPSCQDIK